MKKLIFILGFLIVPLTASAQSWDKGFFFRDSSGYCGSDPSYGGYARSKDSGTGDTYPTSRTINGSSVTFGSTADPGDSRRDRDSSLCSIGLSGLTFEANSAGSPALWRVDLPSAGTYDIRFALGRPFAFGSPGKQKACIFDDTTQLFCCTLNTDLTAGHYLDANCTDHSSPTNWSNNNTAVRATFSTTTLILKYGFGDGSTSGETMVDLLRITSVDATPTPTATPTNTNTPTPTATNTPTPTPTSTPTPTPTATPALCRKGQN